MFMRKFCFSETRDSLIAWDHDAVGVAILWSWNDKPIVLQLEGLTTRSSMEHAS